MLFKDYCPSVITRVTGKNQVTVPAEVVAKAGLKPGTRLEWRITRRADVIEVRVLPDQASLAQALRGAGQRSQRKRGSPVDRLIAERSQDEASRSSR
jgi:bifunctional DNA-binding transcriptional regulator/antitoxin component of YhaV-PrlF toxin-antitoxin module